MKKLPFEGRLLVCDMDGTLLNSSSRVSMENKAALDRFVEGGGLFTVATGRIEETVRLYLPDLPVNLPTILYNGAAIYDFKAEKTCWANNLYPGFINPLKQVMENFPGIGVQLYNSGMIYLAAQNDYTRAHMIRERFSATIAEVDDIPRPWNKALLAWAPDKLQRVEEYLDKFDEPFRHVYSEAQFLEILDKGVTKGNALKELRKLMRLTDKRIIAMGDNMNDIEMIKEADVGIAVGNAHESVKAAADICCTSNDMHAVSEVIDWMESGRI